MLNASVSVIVFMRLTVLGVVMNREAITAISHISRLAPFLLRKLQKCQSSLMGRYDLTSVGHSMKQCIELQRETFAKNASMRSMSINNASTQISVFEVA